MELNGVANIKMIVQKALSENTECHTTIEVNVADEILEQLDLLNRYLISVSNTIEALEGGYGYDDMDLPPLPKLPHWHEVRENREKYPTLAEMVGKTLKEGR